MAYPRAALLVIDGLIASTRTHIASADVRPGVPSTYSFGSKLIVVRRIGGGPDEEDVTDYPVIQVACHAPTYLASIDMQADVEDEILSWPMKQIGPKQILVDEASIYTGEQEIPDIYPDERRVAANYQLGLRRQFSL